MSLAEVQFKIKLTVMNLHLEAAHRKYWKQEVDKCETEVEHLVRMLKDPNASKTDIAVQQRLVNEYDQMVVKDMFLSAYNEVVKLEKILKMLRGREKEILRHVTC
jgi:DNA-binding protein YbaB